MTVVDFRDRLHARADQADLALQAGEIEQLDQYFRLLLTWNRKINLTSLPLNPPTDEALDRLLIEPLAAARYLERHAEWGQARVRPGPDPKGRWVDLGSGGGSPAIPLKVALPALGLTMIESKSRKVAFLREVARALDLQHVCVLNGRFEDISDRDASADVVTVRAVRNDATLEATAARLLRDHGRLLTFRPTADRAILAGFEQVDTVGLTSERRSYLHVYARLFHVEQTR